MCAVSPCIGIQVFSKSVSLYLSGFVRGEWGEWGEGGEGGKGREGGEWGEGGEGGKDGYLNTLRYISSNDWYIRDTNFNNAPKYILWIQS